MRDKSLTTAGGTAIGFVLAALLGLGVVLPLGVYAAFHLPSGYYPLGFLAMFLIVGLTIGVGGHLINRRQFTFREDEQVVEIATIWLLFRTKTQTIPFTSIRSLILKTNHEGPTSLDMTVIDGQPFTLKRSGSTRKLRTLANRIAAQVGFPSSDRGWHWS